MNHALDKSAQVPRAPSNVAYIGANRNITCRYTRHFVESDCSIDLLGADVQECPRL